MREWTFEGAPRGLPLRVCEWGERSSDLPPVLILHGFLEQGASWDGVGSRLGRHTLAPDLRGHGRSGHVGAGGYYHFFDYLADVDALVAQLGPVDLVGHSMGGSIAVYFAGARPELVRHLVLVEGLGPPDTRAEVVARTRRHLDQRRAPPTQPTLDGVGSAAERMRRWNPSLTQEVAAALAARVTEPVDGGVRWSWDPLHRCTNGVPFDSEVFCAFLAEIRAPTLLIDGSDSPFRLDDHARRASRIRDCSRRTLKGGHLIHHDAAVELAAVIAEFVADK